MAEDGGVGGARYSESGEAEETEESDRVEDDVNDGPVVWLII